MAIEAPTQPVQPSETSSQQTPETPWWTKKAAKIGAGVAALVTAVGASIGLNTAQNSGDGLPPVPAATSEAPAPTPEVTESVEPLPELPFDQNEVDLLAGKSLAEFEKYPESARIGYWLQKTYYQVYYDEKYSYDNYGDKTNQPLLNGKKLHAYNPFKQETLGPSSDAEDIVYGYVFGEALAIAHNSPEDAAKLVSGYVRIGTESYNKELDYVQKKAGGRLDDDEVVSGFYRVSGSKLFEKDGERRMRIITDRAELEFAYVPVEGLSDANKDTSDDGEESGVWLLVEDKIN